jgi:hypothetical protein
MTCVEDHVSKEMEMAQKNAREELVYFLGVK